MPRDVPCHHCGTEIRRLDDLLTSHRRVVRRRTYHRGCYEEARRDDPMLSPASPPGTMRLMAAIGLLAAGGLGMWGLLAGDSLRVIAGVAMLILPALWLYDYWATERHLE